MKGCLILANGQKFYGQMLMDTPAVGEVVFNTGMTGYQETFTDPSYADHYDDIPSYRQLWPVPRN